MRTFSSSPSAPGEAPGGRRPKIGAGQKRLVGVEKSDGRPGKRSKGAAGGPLGASEGTTGVPGGPAAEGRVRQTAVELVLKLRSEPPKPATFEKCRLFRALRGFAGGSRGHAAEDRVREKVNGWGREK